MSDEPNKRARDDRDPVADLEHKLAQIVWQWLRNARESQAAILEAELDRAVRDTFPASDPIAQNAVSERQGGLDEIDCIIADGSLTMQLHATSLASAEGDERSPAAYILEGQSPDGDRLKIYVYTRHAASTTVSAPTRSSETDAVDRPGAEDSRAEGERTDRSTAAGRGKAASASSRG